MDWTDKTVLITGGTASFGWRFTQILLTEFLPKKLIIFRRDELKAARNAAATGRTLGRSIHRHTTSSISTRTGL